MRGFCRPPHGGRGLKYKLIHARFRVFESSPSRGTWIEMGRATLPMIAPKEVVPLTGDVD